MIGPILVGCGALMAGVRIATCFVPPCASGGKRKDLVADKSEKKVNDVILNNLGGDSFQETKIHNGAKDSYRSPHMKYRRYSRRGIEKLKKNIGNSRSPNSNNFLKNPMSDDDSSSSTFSDSEDKVPPFLSAEAQKNEVV